MSNQDTAPFFGFIGAASALVFSCEYIAGSHADSGGERIIEVEKWREGTRRIGEIRTAGFNADQSSISDSGMGAAYGTAKSGASVQQ